MRLCIFITLVCAFNLSKSKSPQNIVTFPNASRFQFGAASAAYQIEGAWNTAGKGENIWDRLTHQHPELILDRSNGDVACDSYHRFREDVELLKNLKVGFYRFSLSWSRILPTGRKYYVNPDGIRYYNELIDELIKNGIVPVVTIFHWDTPQPLQDLGGFANVLIVDWFEEYAKVVFDNFGDRVSFWIVFNEPAQICLEGMGMDKMAPALNASGTGEYLCAHNLLKAHARVWHLYDTQYRQVQKGKVGITLDGQWREPITSSPENVEAAERVQQFTFAWYSDPIFGKNGDYPQVMKDFIADRSKKEGFEKSRLPKFTTQEVAYIKGTYDFLGFNHYTSMLVENTPNAPYGEPSFLKDIRARMCADPSWPATHSDWFKVVPCGFAKILVWIKERYKHDPRLEIYITENGYSSGEELNDKERINYHIAYLSAMKDAMDYGVNINGYAIWSLLDNFEWRDGYQHRFGIHHVNFQDPARTRTPKASAEFFKDLIANRKLDNVEGVSTCNIEEPLKKTIGTCIKNEYTLQ